MSVLISLTLSLVLCQNAFAAKSEEFFSRHQIDAATEMKKYINESVSPCDDFYKFACGHWTVVHPAIDWYSSPQELIVEKFKLKIKEVLESPDGSEDNEIDRKVKTFYQSCINNEANYNSDEYHQQLLKIADEFGGMPAVKGDDWDEDNFDWLETIAKISYKYDKDIILGLYVEWNPAKNKPVISIEPELEMRPYPFLYADKEFATIQQEFKQVVAEMLTYHLHLSDKIAAQVAEEIFELESSLAKGLNEAEIENKDLTLTTATALTQKYGPTLNIEKLVNITLPQSSNDLIYEAVESYQHNLVKVLKTVPKRILANYIIYELLADFTNIFYENVTTVDACAEKTTQLFPKHLDKMVYTRYYTEAREQDFNSIWQKLKETFEVEMYEWRFLWIHQLTMWKAVKKLYTTKMEINTHKNYDSVKELGDLEILANDYFGNVKRTIEQEAARRSKMDMHKLAIVDADDLTPRYSPTENTVKIPVEYLELYFGDAPLAVKFAVIGSLLAKCLLYGFFGDAIKADEHGNENLNRTSVQYWLDGLTAAGFKEVEQCFFDRFNEDSYGDFQVRKNVSLFDIMVENAGMDLAIYAYQKYCEYPNSKVFERLPSMKFTRDQLFFIAYAQTKCEHIHSTQLGFFNAADYIPSAVAVNNALSKSERFSIAFGCHEGDSMYKNRNNNCLNEPRKYGLDEKIVVDEF